MRPRVFPAEDLEGALEAVELRLASMRPRVFPAEDSLRVLDGLIGLSGLQ